MIEYLSEIETELENTLAFLSGAQMGLNHEKNGGRKSHPHSLYMFFCRRVSLLILCMICLYSYQPNCEYHENYFPFFVNNAVQCSVYSVQCTFMQEDYFVNYINLLSLVKEIINHTLFCHGE